MKMMSTSGVYMSHLSQRTRDSTSVRHETRYCTLVTFGLKSGVTRKDSLSYLSPQW